MFDGTPKVLIVGTSFEFPYGQGAATRAYMYAKALQSAGAQVRVVSLQTPSRSDSSEAERAAGTYDGIPFEYACGTRVRPASFIRRRLLMVRLVLRTFSLVRRATREAPGRGAVLIYSGIGGWIVLLATMARMTGAVSVLDLCEYPRGMRVRGARPSFLREARRRFVFPKVDGVIPISTYLGRYVAETGHSTARLMVPVMVDTDAFGVGSGPPEGVGRRVVYCGALGRFEEVARALRSFAVAASDLDDAMLVIIGYGPPEREAQAKALVDELGLEAKVWFTGDVRREALPDLFATAEAFVLPRPPGVVADAGLPNKLGEYLATGRPVVVNANGDIPKYLTDGVNAYLVDAHDEAAFTARLRHVLLHRQEAAAVGARGRDAAIREFDYRRHGPRLLGFLAACAATRADA